VSRYLNQLSYCTLAQVPSHGRACTFINEKNRTNSASIACESTARRCQASYLRATPSPPQVLPREGLRRGSVAVRTGWRWRFRVTAGGRRAPNGGGLKGVRVGGRWRVGRWGWTPVCGIVPLSLSLLTRTLSLPRRSGMLNPLPVGTSVRDQPPTCVYGPRLRRKRRERVVCFGGENLFLTSVRDIAVAVTTSTITVRPTLK